jgi:hypothetical protein
MPTAHLHGGAIMGPDASNSVTNGNGQTHEVPNLWMAGPCIFPTEGASNPTYTIFAAALRGAEHLAEHWESVAGRERWPADNGLAIYPDQQRKLLLADKIDAHDSRGSEVPMEATDRCRRRSELSSAVCRGRESARARSS